MDDLISRQAAMDALDKRFENIPMKQTTEILLLRKDLRELPSAQPETNCSEFPNNSDTISRQAAIDAAIEAADEWDGGCNVEREKLIKSYISKLPSAQPTFDARDTQYNLPIGTDLISRQKAIEVVQNRHMMLSKEKVLLINDLEKLPSAQPEIIRCRNCKFASGDSRICMKFDHSPIGELDFCSFAERREVTT